MKIDLHCHTLASDGHLSVPVLLERAQRNGVRQLAITDHDTLVGVKQAWDLRSQYALDLVSGIEFSGTWSGMTIHIVGLGFDLNHSILANAVEKQKIAREQRAKKIGKKLHRLGVQNAYEGAKQIAGNSQIGRPHFAQLLVANQRVKSPAEAFKKYLGRGKPGDISCHWPSLEQVVSWVKQAGGVAILAHPGKYAVTNTKLRRLLRAFCDAGGQAMEVVSGLQNKDVTRFHGQLCNEFELHGSCGSDFHGPATPWSDLGLMSEMPKNCAPVSDLLN